MEIPPKAIDYDIMSLANVVYGSRDREERVIKKIRIDLGWSFVKKPPVIGEDGEVEEEEAENPDMDIGCAFYDAKGEEIQVHHAEALA